jgi:hypothetical protein
MQNHLGLLDVSGLKVGNSFLADSSQSTRIIIQKRRASGGGMAWLKARFTKY